MNFFFYRYKLFFQRWIGSKRFLSEATYRKLAQYRMFLHGVTESFFSAKVTGHGKEGNRLTMIYPVAVTRLCNSRTKRYPFRRLTRGIIFFPIFMLSRLEFPRWVTSNRRFSRVSASMYRVSMPLKSTTLGWNSRKPSHRVESVVYFLASFGHRLDSLCFSKWWKPVRLERVIIYFSRNFQLNFRSKKWDPQSRMDGKSGPEAAETLNNGSSWFHRG